MCGTCSAEGRIAEFKVRETDGGRCPQEGSGDERREK